LALELGLLAGDVGLQVGERLHEDVVGDDCDCAPRRGVETYPLRLAFLDPQQLSGRLEAWTVVDHSAPCGNQSV